MELNREILKNLGLIVAMGKNREIGYKNALIWRIREDLNFFRDTTMNSYIIMGRKTYESMPKNLSNRKYIVLSRDRSLSLDESKILHRDIRETLEFVSNHAGDRFWVVGGSAIYEATLPYVSLMHITEIFDTCDNADAFFPDFDKGEWIYSFEETLLSEENIRYRHTLSLSKR